MHKYCRFLAWLLISCAFFSASNLFAAERSCAGEFYAEYEKDSFTLFRITASAKASTVNAARRAARDMLVYCTVDTWRARWELLGSSQSADLPESCRKVKGFFSWDIDIKKRIVQGACALWAKDLDKKGELSLQIRLKTKGAEGCGRNNDLQGVSTVSLDYRLTQKMCRQGY